MSLAGRPRATVIASIKGIERMCSGSVTGLADSTTASDLMFKGKSMARDRIPRPGQHFMNACSRAALTDIKREHMGIVHNACRVWNMDTPTSRSVASCPR